MTEFGINRESQVREFHEAFGHPIDSYWDDELLIFRLKLLSEEVGELVETVHDMVDQPYEGCEAAMLKEICDVQYVLSGMAVALGLDLEEAFARVHKSNMSKLGADGKPQYRYDGKVLKGPNYEEPYLEDLIK